MQEIICICTGILCLGAMCTRTGSLSRVSIPGTKVTCGRAWSFTEGARPARKTLWRVRHTCSQNMWKYNWFIIKKDINHTGWHYIGRISHLRSGCSSKGPASLVCHPRAFPWFSNTEYSFLSSDLPVTYKSYIRCQFTSKLSNINIICKIPNRMCSPFSAGGEFDPFLTPCLVHLLTLVILNLYQRFFF